MHGGPDISQGRRWDEVGCEQVFGVKRHTGQKHVLLAWQLGSQKCETIQTVGAYRYSSAPASSLHRQ